MGIAARQSQPSSPTDEISFYDEILFDDSVVFHQRRLIGVSDEVSLDDFIISIGTAVYIGVDDEVSVDTNLIHFYLNNFYVIDELSIDVSQNFTEQLIPFEPVGSSDVGSRLDNIEFDFVYSSINPAFYKEFTYSGENLSGYSLYSDSLKTVTLFNVSFILSGDLLSQKIINRVSDNKTLTIDFSYLGGNLISQNRTLS